MKFCGLDAILEGCSNVCSWGGHMPVSQIVQLCASRLAVLQDGNLLDVWRESATEPMTTSADAFANAQADSECESWVSIGCSNGDAQWKGALDAACCAQMVAEGERRSQATVSTGDAQALRSGNAPLVLGNGLQPNISSECWDAAAVNAMITTTVHMLRNTKGRSS